VDAPISHEPDNRRFVMPVEGSLAVLDYERRDDGTLVYQRVYVPPPLRGRGLASQLTAYALDYALAARVGVVPQCPFVADFVERHPKYRSLIRA
jgi:uncharacterized protein